MTTKRFFTMLLVTAAFLISATTALADTSQEFCEGGGSICGAYNGLFNNMEIFSETAGVTFANVGTINCDSFGCPDVGTTWSAAPINGQYLQYTSILDQVNPLAFTLSITGSGAFTLDFYATLGGVVVDSTGIANDGAGNWTAVPLVQSGLGAENTSATPEPMSMVLIGSGLLGLVCLTKQLSAKR